MSRLEIAMVYFNSASGMQRPQDLRVHFEEMREAGVDSIITQTVERGFTRGRFTAHVHAHDRREVDVVGF